MKVLSRLTILLSLPFYLFTSCAYLEPILFTGSGDESAQEETGISVASSDGKNKNEVTDETLSKTNRNEGKLPVDVAKYRSRTMDERVKNVPSAIKNAVFKRPESAITKLVDFLVKDEPDLFLQVKTIHDWITDNIAYDTSSFFSGNVPSQDWEQTLRSGKSVCEGYSGLFNKMCDIAGITSVKIHGYARGYGFDLFGPEDLSDSNHAWNAVQINGYWYLVDCTWDAGNVNGTSFQKDYTTAYLFVKPEHIIYTHVPMDPSWQLLDTPLKAEKLEKLPYYRGSYFLYGMEPDTEITKSTRVEDSFSFSIIVPDGVNLFAIIVDSNGKEYDSYCLIQNNSNKTEIMIKFPEAGQMGIAVICKRQGYEPIRISS